MHPLAAPRPGLYLADVRPHSKLIDAVLVLSGTALIALAALVTIPLPFTPVPITLATFAVMGTGAVLGTKRGALSAGLYLVIGAAGAPVFASGHSGVGLPTFGYIIGFVAAAAVAGVARRQADRRLSTTLLLGAIGTLVIYAFGVPWLAMSLGVGIGQAIALGVVPFLIGDALKIIVLSAMLPAAWRAVASVSSRGRRNTP